MPRGIWRDSGRTYAGCVPSSTAVGSPGPIRRATRTTRSAPPSASGVAWRHVPPAPRGLRLPMTQDNARRRCARRGRGELDRSRSGAYLRRPRRARLDAGVLDRFETAARYHLVHALAAAFAADRAGRGGGAAAERAAGLFLAGIGLFSGSLYALALGGPHLVGAITPLGGVSFMAGWVLLAASFRSR